MTTRHLKWLTGGLIVLGVCLMAGWPWIVGTPPRKGTRAEYKSYLERSLAAATGLVVIVGGAGAGAFFLMRRAREEYREESLRNMRELLEATREDQLKKREDEVAEE